MALAYHMNNTMYHSYVWCRHPWKIITGFCTFELISHVDIIRSDVADAATDDATYATDDAATDATINDGGGAVFTDAVFVVGDASFMILQMYVICIQCTNLMNIFLL